MPSEFVSSGVSYQNPKSDNITAAVDHLRSEYEHLMKQAAAVKAIIENIESRRTESGDTPLPAVRADEYKGSSARDALEFYLKHPQRRSARIPFIRIVKDLLAGGADPGKSRGKQNDPARLMSHSLKIAMIELGPGKGKQFEYEPFIPPKGLLKKVPEEKIFVWLSAGADEPKRRKRGK